MWASITMFLTLTIFEYLAWVSPAKSTFERLSQRYFYICNPYYVPRIGILLLVLLVFHPHLWSPFTGGVSWVSSLGLGIALCTLSYLTRPRRKDYARGELWKKARAIHDTNPRQFWKITAYIVVYPGIVEELIFRWFFIAVMQPYLGWWVLLLEPLICMLWHYPVIISQPWMYTGGNKPNWRGLFGWSTQAFVIGFLLTLVSVTTHNIAGAVLAHSFSNWLGITDAEERAEA